MAADPSWEPVRPEGLALALYVTTVVLSVLCTIVVALRTYIRTKNQCIGNDDYLMCAGWLAYMGHNIIIIIGCHRGIGTVRHKLETAQVQEAAKYVFMWQIFYAATLAFVKSSICVTVLRIATGRIYVRILQALIIMSVAMSGLGVILVLVQCRPIEAHWIPAKGACMGRIVPTVLTYAASVSNVITDFAVAIIPMCLVRKLQMRAKLKFYAQLIMGLGMLSSIASIIRIPYSNAYMTPDNFVYHVGNIILWTVVECGVGVVAGSLPSLRALFKSLTKDRSTNDYSGSHHTTDLLTIGRDRGRPSRTTAIELGTNRPGSNESNDGPQDQDNDSTRRIIVEVTRFIYNILRLLLVFVTGFRQSVTAITLQHAWPLTEQQIYHHTDAFFRSIDDDAIQALGTQHHINSLPCKIKVRHRGSFNGCFMLEFTDGSTRLVRLPLEPAVHDAWSKIRSEVCTMQYVRRNTNIPVPQVYSQLTRKALETSLEPRRRRFLQQLIDVFAELRKLPFTRGGSLMPSNNEDFKLENPPDIVGAFSIRKNELQAAGYTMSRIVATSATEFFDEQCRVLQHMWTMPYKDLDHEQAEREEFAQRYIRQPEVQGRIVDSTCRTFFLTQPDLHPGNILVDDELDICVIIDWEFAASVPRCVSVPPTWITGNDLGLADLPSDFTRVLYSMKEKSEYLSQLAADWGSRDPLGWSLSHILLDPAELDFVFWEKVMPYVTGLCDIPIPDNVQLQADVCQRLGASQRFAHYLDTHNLNVEEREEAIQRLLQESRVLIDEAKKGAIAQP
ncbi:hypothetical protein FZEAL_7285 [Fusarium zealandicum]|uniref:Rhodopsin domain-containing protein n=1 Tax=Fusarium zealandicum TaxID=1053134 RepID=A0A8H4XIS9_9HYPO|nr:hypothetical protein FZEAL_7285 [Fusarium zealandicum]